MEVGVMQGRRRYVHEVLAGLCWAWILTMIQPSNTSSILLLSSRIHLGRQASRSLLTCVRAKTIGEGQRWV
ncbi:uncharacterized protein CCOS01_00689 [Colletotrichum costaricense]|uniref:Uncharacterized protein n=1 Tax=Colletotrichum costaricense TaxID=1209916 RepID=A0AAI9Z9J6_9PEZI|nr:uncharacterized protein CCOS01_00689 [Colletotrichum costaricense]KAK1539375.1 hypothetical protein CCOS01_00689 [Colletotrichum costaricense]